LKAALPILISTKAGLYTLGRYVASKLLERIFVEGFLKHIDQDLHLVAERETPDFVLSDARGQFGLEVAQIFRDRSESGSPSKAAESRRSKYLMRLASDYYSRSGLPLLMKATIPDQFQFDVHALTDRLIAERNDEPWRSSKFSLGPDTTFDLTPLPDEAGQYSRWVCINNSVGWRGWLGVDDLRPTIEDKSQKLEEYRAATTRVSLLLVVDVTQPSGMLRWPDNAVPPEARGFDAVYLYLHPREARRLA
jgi:hypothetical protein